MIHPVQRFAETCRFLKKLDDGRLIRFTSRVKVDLWAGDSKMMISTADSGSGSNVERIGEHLWIAGLVVVITHWVGDLLGTMAR